MEMDRAIEEAAMDLGARPIPGVFSGHHAQYLSGHSGGVPAGVHAEF
jgi:hypothetical protein